MGRGIVIQINNAFCWRTKRTFRGRAPERARVGVRRRVGSREDRWWQRSGEGEAFGVLCGCVAHGSRLPYKKMRVISETSGFSSWRY